MQYKYQDNSLLKIGVGMGVEKVIQIFRTTVPLKSKLPPLHETLIVVSITEIASTWLIRRKFVFYWT